MEMEEEKEDLEREEGNQFLRYVTKIKDVEGTEKADKYVGRGWRLLKVLTKKRGHPEFGFEDVAVYVVGWPYRRKPDYPK